MVKQGAMKKFMYGGADSECGPVKEVFWQGSRFLGVITTMFVVAFGIWSMVSLLFKNARSPFDLLGVRPVENCQAYINKDFVVDCSVPQCPEGCVRGESPTPECTSNEECVNDHGTGWECDNKKCVDTR